MLEIKWGVQMESFYTQNVGKYLREIMLEPNLAQLKLLLGDEADVAIDYLWARRELYDVCVRQHLDEFYDYEDKIEAFLGGPRDSQGPHHVWPCVNPKLLPTLM